MSATRIETASPAKQRMIMRRAGRFVRMPVGPRGVAVAGHPPVPALVGLVLVGGEA